MSTAGLGSEDGEAETERRIAALEQAVEKADKARREAERRAELAEGENRKLAVRLADLEAAEDPLPEGFDEVEAARIVDRLLGISKLEMTRDVEALLWTNALRRLGVLDAKEYVRRKKQLLAGIAPGAAPADPPTPPEGACPATGPPAETPADVAAKAAKP